MGMKTKYIFLINITISQNVRKNLFGHQDKFFFFSYLKNFFPVAFPGFTYSFLDAFNLISAKWSWETCIRSGHFMLKTLSSHFTCHFKTHCIMTLWPSSHFFLPPMHLLWCCRSYYLLVIFCPYFVEAPQSKSFASILTQAWFSSLHLCGPLFQVFSQSLTSQKHLLCRNWRIFIFHIP